MLKSISFFIAAIPFEHKKNRPVFLYRPIQMLFSLLKANYGIIGCYKLYGKVIG